MAFFDKIGKKIGDVAGSAADKAKDLAEITKLNASVSAEEKQMNQYFLEIGKLIFEQEKENPNSPAAALIKKILESQKIIADLKQRIIEIKEDKDDDEPPIPVDAKNVTPAEQPPSEPQFQEGDASAAQIVCPKCGTVNPATSKFCQNCGNPLSA